MKIGKSSSPNCPGPGKVYRLAEALHATHDLTAFHVLNSVDEAVVAIGPGAGRTRSTDGFLTYHLAAAPVALARNTNRIAASTKRWLLKSSPSLKLL